LRPHNRNERSRLSGNAAHNLMLRMGHCKVHDGTLADDMSEVLRIEYAPAAVNGEPSLDNGSHRSFPEPPGRPPPAPRGAPGTAPRPPASPRQPFGPRPGSPHSKKQTPLTAKGPTNPFPISTRSTARRSDLEHQAICVLVLAPTLQPLRRPHARLNEQTRCARRPAPLPEPPGQRLRPRPGSPYSKKQTPLTAKRPTNPFLVSTRSTARRSNLERHSPSAFSF
jgi:hypothetical protein